MASDRLPGDTPTDPRVQPTGVEGEGMDPYPTYRDGAVPPHSTTGMKPTDTGLPRSRRTFGTPMLIGLMVFAIILLVIIFGGLFNTAETTDEAMTPGDPASAPATTAPADAAAPETSADPAAEAPGTLDQDVEIQPGTGPTEAPVEPGGIDVPGTGAQPGGG